MRRILWIIPLLGLILVGCQPAINTDVPATPEVWRVQVSPALRWLSAGFHTCASTLPGVALLYDEKPAPSLNPAAADFTISLEPVKGAAYTAILGQSQLTVIANPANPVMHLSLEEVEAIFGGSIVDWAGLAKGSCPECAAASLKAIQPYVYAEGDDFGRVVSSLLPGIAPRQANALLAPDPQAVRQAVGGDVNAIGMVPAFWLDSSVKAVTIDDPPANGLSFPVVLSAASGPTGAKLSWLLCVEKGIQ